MKNALHLLARVAFIFGWKLTNSLLHPLILRRYSHHCLGERVSKRSGIYQQLPRLKVEGAGDHFNLVQGRGTRRRVFDDKRRAGLSIKLIDVCAILVGACLDAAAATSFWVLNAAFVAMSLARLSASIC